jgi:hypothetical protein
VSRIDRRGRGKQHRTTIEERLREKTETNKAQSRTIGLKNNWLLSKLICKQKISY